MAGLKTGLLQNTLHRFGVQVLAGVYCLRVSTILWWAAVMESNLVGGRFLEPDPLISAMRLLAGGQAKIAPLHKHDNLGPQDGVRVHQDVIQDTVSRIGK